MDRVTECGDAAKAAYSPAPRAAGASSAAARPTEVTAIRLCDGGMTSTGSSGNPSAHRRAASAAIASHSEACSESKTTLAVWRHSAAGMVASGSGLSRLAGGSVPGAGASRFWTSSAGMSRMAGSSAWAIRAAAPGQAPRGSRPAGTVGSSRTAVPAARPGGSRPRTRPVSALPGRSWRTLSFPPRRWRRDAGVQPGRGPPAAAWRGPGLSSVGDSLRHSGARERTSMPAAARARSSGRRVCKRRSG